jgi:hypothetical protein
MFNKQPTFSTFCNRLSWGILCFGLLYVLIHVLCWPYGRRALPETIMNIPRVPIWWTITEDSFQVTFFQVVYVLLASLIVRLIGEVYRLRRRTPA